MPVHNTVSNRPPAAHRTSNHGPKAITGPYTSPQRGTPVGSDLMGVKAGTMISLANQIEPATKARETRDRMDFRLVSITWYGSWEFGDQRGDSLQRKKGNPAGGALGGKGALATPDMPV